ncbi:hypothetical protein RI578_25675 [Streptomyces sp. BB1-1-1]|uniref:hypothetical protein n=1 Tax=Streptomyces sp. BB1-1-1 TaxID=3074430 RepID=UPI0028772C0F|nr:hypothetical protein [Streptomyces sp. BB1-1-1]WND37469.1 hypothetical protein RI578_25675 [Streptomyces sp. BB1-1-1]
MSPPDQPLEMTGSPLLRMNWAALCELETVSSYLAPSLVPRRRGEDGEQSRQGPARRAGCRV